MPTNATDRRVLKTIRLLQDAMIELISENGYDAVTIQEILDRANVGRSTFYAHFENKDQLLNSILVRLNEGFEQRNHQAVDGKTRLEEKGGPDLPFTLLLFVEQNHRFFKSILGNPSNGAVNQPIYDYLYALAYRHLRLLVPSQKTGALRLEMMVHYYVSALCGVLVWWLQNDRPYSVEELGQLLRQLTLPGLREVMGSIANRPPHLPRSSEETEP